MKTKLQKLKDRARELVECIKAKELADKHLEQSVNAIANQFSIFKDRNQSGHSAPMALSLETDFKAIKGRLKSMIFEEEFENPSEVSSPEPEPMPAEERDFAPQVEEDLHYTKKKPAYKEKYQQRSEF